MSTTNYGVDYAIGQSSNRNTETGIRYGIIATHRVSPDALDDIYTHGTDEDYAAWRETIEQAIRNSLDPYLSKKAIDRVIASGLEDIGDDYTGTGDYIRYSYEADGYKLQIDSSGDLWVMDSPYVTYAQFCSPCAPGACYLSNPLEDGYKSEANKCYCLGPDWFDDEQPMPYVATKL